MASTVTATSSTTSSLLSSLLSSPGTPPVDFYRSLSEILGGEKDTKEEAEFQPWIPREITQDVALMRMWKGLHEAIEDAQKEDVTHRAIYATAEQVIPTDILASLFPKADAPGAGTKRKAVETEPGTLPKAIKADGSAEGEVKMRDQPLTWDVVFTPGKRPKMEDDHIVMHTTDELVAAVADGHGGPGVANFVRKEIKTRFFSILAAVDGNIFMAFERCVYTMHQEVLKKPEFKFMGTTLVLTYIDIRMKKIYTSSVGDSGAAVHRKIGGDFRVVPLCPRRNWGHPGEAARAAKILKDPKIAEDWPKSETPKKLRVQGVTVHPNGKKNTLNLSRGIGDSDYGHLVSQEPVISMCQLISGDIVEVYSDGVSDYLPVAERSEVIAKMAHLSPGAIAKRIHDMALEGMKEIGDNITVIVIKV